MGYDSDIQRHAMNYVTIRVGHRLVVDGGGNGHGNEVLCSAASGLRPFTVICIRIYIPCYKKPTGKGTLYICSYIRLCHDLYVGTYNK